ncbi:exodeoxyribonuclease III [Parachitinimonas caeni]|uniref:Exodeoxyribonuclease III n=1 Tax=Parachitinimonas caeni TaxID=3031301 RepID=A0ABT7DXP9_9NEIS|nr:exodeoxyribonuclease III [Parachitinimonas caeni]MDK2124769.1 exodeoxyribonuclease III [Parachitinimonas caeni]
MQIATWNVNSLKVRLPQVLEWLAAHPQLDCLCLQETKLEDINFPEAAIREAGWQVAFAGQKTYNGVALISREPATDIQINLPNYSDHQMRLIAGTFGEVRLICGYFPNGQSLDSEKYPYKLAWLEALIAYVGDQLKQYPQLALLGDYNIAPEDRDVHDPAKWVGQVLVSEPERAAFNQLISLGLHDSFRKFDQPEQTFSWWDYRAAGFRRNAGLRIDHILLSDPLIARCTGCVIDKEARKAERPSDHAPVIATLD